MDLRLYKFAWIRANCCLAWSIFWLLKATLLVCISFSEHIPLSLSSFVVLLATFIIVVLESIQLKVVFIEYLVFV